MKQVIFLYDKLINPKEQIKRRLPLSFISFGFIPGKLHYYSMNKNLRNVFATNEGGLRKWGNKNVFGALFVLEQAEYYLRNLEGILGCSYSRLHSNNSLDLMHRCVIQFTPIFFSSLEDFSDGKYSEGESIKCITYYGNCNHPAIKHRINSNKSKNSYRVSTGIDIVNFKKLYKEVTSETKRRDDEGN